MIRLNFWALSLCIFLCARIYGQSSISDPANPEDITTWYGKTIIFFSPHEDDDLEAAGTMAKLVKNGNKVLIVLYTNGNKGTHDLEMTSERLAQIRKQEDLAANKILGIPQENIFFLGYDDGMLEYVPQKEIVEKVCYPRVGDKSRSQGEIY